MNTVLCTGLLVCACLAYAAALPAETIQPAKEAQVEHLEQDLQPEESHWGGGWGRRGYGGYGGYGGGWGHGYGGGWGRGYGGGWGRGYGGGWGRGYGGGYGGGWGYGGGGYGWGR